MCDKVKSAPWTGFPKLSRRALTIITGDGGTKGAEGQILADPLTHLKQGADYAPYITARRTRPPDFQTFRHPCVHRVKDIFMKFSIMK